VCAFEEVKGGRMILADIENLFFTSPGTWESYTAFPEYERYEREYGDERTAIELKRAEEVRRECTNA
jgi:hypothetical protein